MLDGPDGPVETNKDMLRVASDFYKNLFAEEERVDMALGPGFWDPEDLFTEENDLLQKPFSEDEIKEAVFGSYACGLLGRMASLFCFTKSFGS